MKAGHRALWGLLFTISSLHPAAALSWETPTNTLMAAIPDSPISGLLVINDPARGSVWGVVDRGILFLLPVDLSIGGRQIVSFDISPDGRLLAVVAVAEDHTTFSLFELKTIFDSPETDHLQASVR